MAKFNEKTDTSIRNYMGGKAFKQAPRVELVHAVLTTFIEDSYYEGKSQKVDRIQKLVKEVGSVDPVFVGKLAVYARDKFNMRSIFHLLVGELSKIHRGDDLVRRVITVGSLRVDDLIEIFSYIGKPLPNQVKKGIAEALTKFDSYQLSKYKATGKKVSLVDLFNVTHPMPVTDAQAHDWGKLMVGQLVNNETWESKLSSGEDSKVVWKEMLQNRKLGYMAALRNLRNILKTGDAETVQLAANFIQNEKAVLNSKQFPFRFLSAYKAISEFVGKIRNDDFVFEGDQKLGVKDASVLIKAIEQALRVSVKNIPLLKGKTVILSDNSGSMRGDRGGKSLLSAYSNRTTADIANLFAILYWTRAENTLVGLFGDRFVIPKLSRDADIFENFNLIDHEADTVGPGTETGIFVAFEKLLAKEEKVDRIVIFSDCQVGTGCNWYDTGSRRGSDFNRLFKKYKEFHPPVRVYSVDLRGYGNTLFSDSVIELAGWSDKIFDLMQTCEIDKDALYKEIESVQL